MLRNGITFVRDYESWNITAIEMGKERSALRVLLLDPRPEAASQTTKLLRSNDEFDVKIRHVVDRQSALDALDDPAPDLALLEHDLDEGTSMSLIREIRADDYRLPIVILTDDGDEHICAEYFRFDVDDYRVKDQLNADILHTTIKYALTRRRKKVQQKRAAKFDELTNLYNRRFTFRRINEELTHATRHDLPFSICLIDLNDFKKINDTHGHLAGDHLLKSVGTCLENSVRSGDIVGRYGGDEFLVGLRNTNSTGAYKAAQKLETTIANRTFDLPQGDAINVRCSIGVAEFKGSECQSGDETIDMEALIDRADQALYRAKEKRSRSVERRRHRRYRVEKPVGVCICAGGKESSAVLRNYSRRGVQLREGPSLQVGQEILLSFEWNGSTIERPGVIRSCGQMENTSKTLVGVEVQRELPDELIDETDVVDQLVS